MQKVSRSIFAGLLLLAGLTACGDKVTVTGTQTSSAGPGQVHSVTITPSTVTLGAGQSVTLVATVDADAGVARTVTWTSTNTAIATVSATGTVTASATGSGTVAIQATSTADPTVSGAASVVVTPTTLATISIASINQTIGGNSVPANLASVAGQLNVTLNVDQGTQTVTALNLIVHNVAANTDTTVAVYNFTSPNKAPVSATSAPVTMSFNTAAFNDTTGAVSFINGAYSIRAQAVVAGATQSPVSSTMTYTLNNVDTMLVAAHGDTVATDASGRQWAGGKITVSVVPVLYSGRGLLNAVVSQPAPFADSATKTLTTFPGTAVFGVNSDTLTDSNYVAFVTAKYSDATQFNSGNPVLANKLRVDNQAPVRASVFALGSDSTAANSLLVPWVNASYVFSKGLANVVDTSAAVLYTGVGGVKTTFYALPSADTLLNNGTATPHSGSGWTACTAPSNAIMAATGAGITQQSAPGDTTTYIGLAVSTDALGNVVCQNMLYTNSASHPVNVFGVDNTAPVNAALADSAVNGNFGPSVASVGDVWHWVLQDSISGFTGSPISATLVWNYHTAATGGCILGTVVSGACTADTTHQNLAVDGATGAQGYYVMTSTISDVAGNTVVIPPATVLIDATSPLGGTAGSVPTGVGDSSVTYTGGVTDNVDLVGAVGGIAYSSYILSYPTTIAPQHAAFSGSRDTTGTVTLTVANHFIDSLAVTGAGDVAPANHGSQAAAALLNGVDGVGNIGGLAINPLPVVAGAGMGPDTLPWSSLFSTFLDNNPVHTGAGSIPLTAQVTNATSAIGVPFQMVCWYMHNTTTGYFDQLGCQTQAVATQTSPTTNTWDWTGPSVAQPASGSYAIIAIGFGTGGRALASQVNSNISH
jgi:Bacterial Ig-like domain (group 2)